ncbi:ABC transporter permease [Bacteroides oleiciplenus]|uniref:ABC transporter permease n=1 Tax=Bacteroides oleiciplenus TaxID=626931 RepID=UPI0026DCB8C4|nr:ABC transporter permease [Bacteroides oleiciplenus]
MHTLKIVLRSWWRNKLFVTISLVSLVIGITCTNLLTAFVLYEYNIEYNNPNRNRILRLIQTLPFAQEEMQGTFVYHESVPEIISQFPEIEAALRTQSVTHTKIRVDNEDFSDLNLLSADSTLEKFFPIETLTGKVKEALTHPGTIAISQEVAKRCFGTTDCIGKLLEIPQSGKNTYRIVAVFRLPSQSMLHADMLTSLNAPEGITCSILLKQGTDIDAFRQRFEATELPTLLGKGYYHTLSLQESYFNTALQDSDQCIEHRQKALLSVGLLSALLILFIGCFNYINLSFSRLLKQIRTLHIECLLGATHRQIRWQLFVDTFLMVIIAFMLSILLMSDLLASFNAIITAKLSLSYLFSSQVLPIILLFVIILSIVPAEYMSRKIHTLSESSYRSFFTGRKKQRIVAALVTLQFIISIGLLSAFMVIRSQMDLIEQEGNRYKGIIEFSIVDSAHSPLQTWIEEIKPITGVESIVPSRSGLYPMSMAVPRKGGEENDLLMLELYEVCPDFLSIYNLELSDAKQTFNLLPRTPIPAIINEAFIRYLVPAGENPIGQPISKYIPEENEKGTIIGVIKDFKKYSLTNNIFPLRMLLHETPQENFTTLTIQFDEKNRAELIDHIRRLWEKKYPNTPFEYTDPHKILMSYNQEVTDFSRILLMYASISLFLTLFGLFGITHYAIRQRIREIGIRKIHGASPWQILWLVNRPFLCYIGIAFVLTIPVICYSMNYWLQQFAYHTHLGIIHFLLPLLFTICITLLTVCLNSYRAARNNPVESIKCE